MYQNILFDLDGTLTDPGVGITNSVAHALAEWGIYETEREKLYPFIGPPLAESFAKYYGFSPEECQRAIAAFREYFRDTGIFENEPYPGVHRMLGQLKSAGKRLILATSKPEEFARRILEHFELSPCFDLVAGATMDEKRVRKGEIIRYALQLAGVTDLSSAVMVGDREQDAAGAREAGIACIGVLYGYGSRQELAEAGVSCFAASPEELVRLLSE